MRRGFTLIEVLVALTLAALVVLLVHRVFAGVVDGVARMNAAQRVLDRTANAHRWLGEAFGSLQAGVDSAGSFEGHPTQVTFSTWQEDALGGFRRRRVVVQQVSQSLVAEQIPGTGIILADSVSHVGFDYLLEPGANTTWAREWLSPVSAPLAVRVRIDYQGIPQRADTLLLVIGGRG